MSGLILELQANALDVNVRVSDLLRKALVVSKKLGIAEIERWISMELNGYDVVSEIPTYRKVRGAIKVLNPYHGWQPLNFEDPDMGEKLSNREIGQAVGELDSLLENRGKGGLQVQFSQKAINSLMNSMEVPLHPTLHVPHTEIVGILDAVRNIVLNWSLELEQKGVIGEGMTFSREERSAAGQTTYQITNNIGSMHNSQLQQHSSSSSQSISVATDIQALLALITELRGALSNLALIPTEYEEFTAELSTLESQAGSPKPKRVVISESLKSARTILEGAAGNILASDLVTKITLFLQSIN